jgi:hypothetical protein
MLRVITEFERNVRLALQIRSSVIRLWLAWPNNLLERLSLRIMDAQLLALESESLYGAQAVVEPRLVAPRVTHDEDGRAVIRARFRRRYLDGDADALVWSLLVFGEDGARGEVLRRAGLTLDRGHPYGEAAFVVHLGLGGEGGAGGEGEGADKCWEIHVGG